MPWASVGLEMLSGQSWWASLRRCGRPGNSAMVWRIEGVVMYVLQICIPSGNWPDSSLRISLLGESRQFPNRWSLANPTPLPKKTPTHKHWIQRRVLLIDTGVCSLVFCLVGWRTFILIPWSSSDARWLLSQPSTGVRVWELAAWMLSLFLYNCSSGHSNKYHLFCRLPLWCWSSKVLFDSEICDDTCCDQGLVPGFWACGVRAAGPFSPGQGLGPKTAIQAVSLFILTGILLISVGMLKNVRAMVSLYENHPNKLILELTMIWLFSKMLLVCNFQWLTGLCRGVI